MALQQGSAPGKSKMMDSAGERELLIHSVRLAVARARLAVNTLETIGVALRHRQISPDAALAWITEEGLLSHIQLGPVGCPA